MRRRSRAWLVMAGVVIISQLAGCGGGNNKGKAAGAEAVEPVPAGERTATGPAEERARPGTAGAAPDAATAKEAAALERRKTYDAPPAMKIDAKKKYFATLKTTKGDIKMELLAGESPGTVNNFVFLAREGFYDGVKFHRIIQDFMVQTGDPNGDGTGGPGYTIKDELPPQHSYEKGIVAMAKTNQPDSAGSQFFICSGPACRNLDLMPDYPQFGRVVAGMDVLDAIAAVPVAFSPFSGEASLPREDVLIKSVVIEEK